MMNSNNNPDHASSQEFEPKEKKETVPQASFSDEKEDNETNRIIE